MGSEAARFLPGPRIRGGWGSGSAPRGTAELPAVHAACEKENNFRNNDLLGRF